MSKILHIEDDPANRLLVRKLLTAAGFEVVDAVDGLDGIRKACTVAPDLVLLDIALPALDGYEVALRLRAEPQLKGVPIVAITAEGSRETSLAVGCDGFLQKPIDARSFASTVRGYLGGRRDETPSETKSEHLRQQSQRIVAHLEQKVAELVRANAQLVEGEQARKEFYRNISHELATPMTPIVGYVKLLRDGELGPLTPVQEKVLRSMDDCVQRLRGLIDDLLDLTGLEMGRLRYARRSYDAAELTRAALRRAGDKARASGHRLLSELELESAPAVGDPARIGRALDELLGNALKFSPAGSAVGLRLFERAPGELVWLVGDDGPGISSADAGRLFEPFHQVDGSETRPHGGTGIGLALVQGAAGGHAGGVRWCEGGALELAGERLGGALFEFWLASSPAESPSSVG